MLYSYFQGREKRWIASEAKNSWWRLSAVLEMDKKVPKDKPAHEANPSSAEV